MSGQFTRKKKWKGRTMNIDSSYLCCRSFLHSCNLISCKKATTKIIKSSPLCASSLFETKRPCSKYLHPQQRIIKSKLSIFPLPTSMQLCRSPLLKSRKWRQNGGSIVRLKGINWRKGGSKKRKYGKIDKETDSLNKNIYIARISPA